MRADAVVCGGGFMGLWATYHLAKRGASVMLFERHCVGSHSGTRISTGLLTSPMFYPDSTWQAMAKSSLELCSKLASGGRFKFNRCGRVYLAQTPPTEIQLRRMLSRLRCTSPNAMLIESRDEMRHRWPMLNLDDITLALFSPDDVALDAHGLARELTRSIVECGATINEGCAVRRVLLGENREVYAVDTDDGLVETRNVINAAGVWSSMVPVREHPEGCIRIPAHPCSYMFLSTDPLPHTGVGESTPVFIDLDNAIYICATEFRTLCGGFSRHDYRPLALPSHTQTHDWQVPPPDWDKFYPALKRLLHRCPSMSRLSHGDLVSGAEMYTPDCHPLFGEYQAKGYYLAAGLNGHGLSWSGGLGSLLADWILNDKQPAINVAKLDVNRFLPLHSNFQYLMERVPEVAGNIFTSIYQSHQCETARNLRMSPIHGKLREAGAIFGENMGYERPLWYSTDPVPYSWDEEGNRQDALIGKPAWFAHVQREYEACRERVGLIDMTSFSKFEVQGSEVLPFLQKICSANIDRPVGSTIYTGMQNENGGYVTDCTLSRMDEHAFFIVAPTVQQLRTAKWIQRWIDEWKMNVRLQDVTSMYTTLLLVGPSSRYLMSDLTGESMSSNSFPNFMYKELNMGMVTGIRVISVTHCGELGWTLYIPNETAQNIYDAIMSAGREHSLQHAGYYALRHLRIEKFYVYWGQDIDATTTPVECGRTFRVDLNKYFIGKEAIERQLERGVGKRFVQLLVDRHRMDEDPWPEGGEPIFRDGKLAGWTTSAAYGFTLGSQVCLGYLQNEEFGLTPEYINRGAYHIEIAGRRFPTRINLHSPSLPMISSEHPQHYRPTQ